MAKKSAATAATAAAFNPFAAAVAKEPAKPKKAEKGTILELPIHWDSEQKTMTPESKKAHVALANFVAAKAELKAAEGKVQLAKGIVGPVALKLYAKNWATRRSMPETPVSITNESGESATYVVQDRTGQIRFSEEQQIALGEIIGPEAVAESIVRAQSFSFNQEVLDQPGVMEKLIAAIGNAGLEPEQAANLVVASTVTRLKPGVVENLSGLCKHDPVMLEAAIEAVGTCLTSYLK